jgi:hypothetical protein
MMHCIVESPFFDFLPERVGGSDGLNYDGVAPNGALAADPDKFGDPPGSVPV